MTNDTVLKLIDALVETLKAQGLEYAYNDYTGESFSWAEIQEIRATLIYNML